MSPGAGPRVAVVVGSGSVKCAAALGLFKVLERERIPVDMVVGCSGGALYAGLMAMGNDIATAETKTRELWTKEITKKRNTRALLSAVLPQIFGFDERFGLVDDRLVLERLRRGFGDARFEDAKIPLYLTATDFHTGEQAVFTNGNVIDAIRASIAIPYIFQPWKIGDRTYVDGFLSDPMPIGVAIKNPLHRCASRAPRRESDPTYACVRNALLRDDLLREAHHTIEGRWRGP